MPAPSYTLPGDIILARGKGWMSDAITIMDGSPVSHATIYYGDDQIMETRAAGVLLHSFDESFAHSSRVYMDRMRLHPDTMQPVLDRADYYLKEGPNYAYDTLYMAAVLCLTRRLPVNRYLRPLLRKLLDQAAKWIIDRRRHGQEALVCSEFVYRCFDEAVSQPNPYSLSIGDSGAFRSSMLRAAAPGAPVRIGQGVQPGSLLDWLAETTEAPEERPSHVLRQSTRTPTEALVASALLDEPADAADMDLERLLEAFVGDARAPAVPRVRGVAAPPAPLSLHTSDIHDAISRFLGAHQAPPEELESGGPEGVRLFRSQAEAVDSRKDELAGFLGTVADFVTPGDLFRCATLYPLGEMDL